MKQLKSFILVILALLITSSAHGQANPFSIGGMIGLDEKRLEAAPSVSFGMAIYNQCPPSEGFEGPGLTGIFTSALGQYPAGNKGLWTKTQIDPFGINNLEGIDRPKNGIRNPRIDRNEDWEPIIREGDGSYTDTRQLNKVGVIPTVYRLRHRAGRDKYQFLIFTATWIRGGNLPAKLEMMVRPEIPGYASMQPNDILPYLSGFQPAYGPLQGGTTQTESNVIPGRSATATADPTQGQGNNSNGQGGNNFPTLNPPTGGQGGSYQQPAPFSVSVSARHSDPVTPETVGQLTGFYPVPEPNGVNTSTTIPLNTSRPTMVLRFESVQPFTVEVRLKDGTTAPAKIERSQTGYVCLVYGRTTNFLDKGIELVVAQQGRTRTIKFRGGN